MADWQNLAARATRTADRLFGEPVCLSFLKDGRLDPARPQVELRAQLHLPEEGEGALARSKSQFSTHVVAGLGLLIIHKSAFNGQLLAGDKVRGLGRDGQPWFEIVSVDSKGADHIVAPISLTTKAR